MAFSISDRDRAPMVGLVLCALGVLVTMISFWSLTWWSQRGYHIGLTGFDDCVGGPCERLGLGNLMLSGWDRFDGLAIGGGVLGTFAFLATASSAGAYSFGVLRLGQAHLLRIAGSTTGFALAYAIWLAFDAPEAASLSFGFFAALFGLSCCLAGTITLDILGERAPLFGLGLPQALMDLIRASGSEGPTPGAKQDAVEDPNPAQADPNARAASHVACRRCATPTVPEGPNRYRCPSCGLINAS